MSSPEKPRVDILMGTFNGAAHVREQIASLRAQSFADWRLLVRDDGSRDATRAIVAEEAAADPRIHVVTDDLGNLGFGDNFRRLLTLSDAPYSMYCDQDDVWLPEKIARCLTRMEQEEAARPGRPVLVHCDARVVDAELRVITQRFVGRAARRRGLCSVLFRNCVQGATMLMNRPLRERALALPPDLPHDWHAALIAELTGARSFVDEALLLYRQHAANVIGAMPSAGDHRAGEVPPLLRSLRWQLGASPNVRRVLDYFAREGGADALRHKRRYEYLLDGRGRARRLLILAREPYSFLGRLDLARLAAAILRGLV